MAATVNTNRHSIFSAMLLWLLPCIFSAQMVFAQNKDSVAVLKTIKVAAIKKQNNYTNIAPVQSLDRETLQQISAQSVGDAASYFSGVLIKDYGGIGGLKTISVRSLGASSTSIVYDGIPVSDVQSGQVDLSRFSATFVQSLKVLLGSIQTSLQPARASASASSLVIATNTFDVKNFQQQNWQAGLKAGSFNLWQPFAGIYQPLKNNTVISVNAEALYSKGNYPFTIENGNISEKANRNNGDIKSIQAEANLLKQFTDSATLQVKTGVYSSERGLPGAIVFFNDRSVQRLWNTDYFLQSRYQKKWHESTALLLSAKYNHTYTRYTDPDFLNNQGGLDSRYTQQEIYASAAASHNFSNDLLFTAASDVSFSQSRSNVSNFANPNRWSFWENIGLQYSFARWQLNAAALYAAFNDKTATASANRSKLTPSVAISFTPAEESPFLFRAFYKAVYRMPTFNDLYYNFIGNSSLRPEFSKQYNIGIAYTKQFAGLVKKFSISADAYYNEVKDKIIAVPNQNLFVWTMLNLGKVSVKGVDVAAEANGKLSTAVTWFARIAYTWQQAIDVTDKSSSTYKNKIPYTPSNAGSGLLSFRYQNWEAGYNTLFSGTRYTLGENNPYNQLDGWMQHGVFVSRKFPFKNFSFHIKGALDNITNERFDVIRYYPMPGRSFKISLLFNNL